MFYFFWGNYFVYICLNLVMFRFNLKFVREDDVLILGGDNYFY